VHSESSASLPSNRRADRRAFVIALAAAIPLLAFFVWRYDFVCDDAYISFRYSRHLAEGRGLVFNAGETPPVEGYSNFLWVVWLAFFELVGLDVTVAARASSIAAGIVLVAAVIRFMQRRLALSTVELAASAAALACLPTLSLWSTGGLETMPFALAAFLTFERLALDPDRPRGGQSGAAALACSLLRADGLLWAGLMIGAAMLAYARSRSPALLRASATAISIATAGTAAHWTWRHGVYGDWLPNTARIKAGLSRLRLERGLDYAVAYVLTVPALALAPVVALVSRACRSEILTIQVAFVLACTFAYAIFVGGDFMPMGRFLIVAMPFVALLVSVIVRALRPTPHAATAFALACAGLCALPSFDVHVVPASVRERFHFRWNDTRAVTEYEMWRGMKERAEHWTLLGRALARDTVPGESIILGNIGAIGYFTELEILDVFGLTNRAVAMREAPLVRASPGHDKAVAPDFFFPEHPDYWGAFLAPAAAPLAFGLPPGLLESTIGQRITIERRSQDGVAGFPPGVELRLARLRWDR
jgi:hypothetical protein